MNKKLMLVFMFGILIFSMASVAAVSKSYDKDTKTVTIKETFLFIPIGDIAEVQLLTPLETNVETGYQRFAEYEVRGKKDIEELFFGETKTYNKKLYDEGFEMELDNQIDLKYKTTEEYEINSYYCPSELKYECYVNGTETRTREIWADFDKKTKIIKDVITTIGLYTTFNQGDNIEWIPEFMNKEVEEWASVIVTSGTETIDGDYTVRTFTSNGYFNFTGDDLDVEVLMVAGGGAGGFGYTAGGGGAGGTNKTNITLTAGNRNVFVGAGGTPSANENANGGNGGNSVFNGITMTGGGGGASYHANSCVAGSNGGSGGGSAGRSDSCTGGTGIAGQGFKGGDYTFIPDSNAGVGGGGSSGAGADKASGDGIASAAGIGTSYSINGSSHCYAGGGGAAGFTTSTDGSCGGGNGANPSGTAAVSNTGSGGGGSYSQVAGGAGGSGVIIIRYLTPILAPTVTLNTPVNTTNSTNPSITFNGTITGEIPANVSLIINGAYNETNSTGGLDDYYFTKTFADGSYTWNYESCTSANGCANGTERTLTIDSTAPTFSVASPTGTTPYWTAGDNEWLNTTITDTNLDTCWYDYNGTNQTFSCSSGVEATNEFPVQISNYNMTIYANDSVGNLGSSFISWNVPFFIATETYDTSILEGGTGSFSLTGETNGTTIDIANLSYDSSGNIGSIAYVGNAFTINESVVAPLVTADTNKTFFWKLTQGSTITSLTSHKQLILNFGIDDCSVNTNVLYNFTIKDEKTQVKLVPGTQNTSAKIDLSVYSALDDSTIGGLNTSFSKINSFSVCLSSNLSAGETYKVDLQAEYGADNYATEFYNIQKSTITSSTLNQNISLYSLDNTTSQIFEIIYRDSSYLPVEGALLTLQRKYIDEGVFKTVEAPVTDSNGQTLVNLELYNAVYTFVFSKDGTVLSTFNKKRVKCDNLVLGQCDYTFNAASSPVLPTSYTIIDGISYVLSYDNDTRVVSNTFTIQDGTVKTVSVNVSLMDSVNSFVCSNQLTSSSGTVSCTVPTKFNNGTAMVKVYQDGVWEGQAQIFLGTNNKDLYGKNIVFLSIFMLLTLFGVGISGNPVVTAIFLFIGAIVGIGMNITGASGVIGAGATVLWLLIAIVLVIIKGSKRD